MHGVYQAQPFFDSAIVHTIFDLAGDVHEIHSGRDVESQILGEGFHSAWYFTITPGHPQRMSSSFLWPINPLG
jgi:hypothetical protein